MNLCGSMDLLVQGKVTAGPRPETPEPIKSKMEMTCPSSPKGWVDQVLLLPGHTCMTQAFQRVLSASQTVASEQGEGEGAELSGESGIPRHPFCPWFPGAEAMVHFLMGSQPSIL